jgi:hypothetical protein
MRLLQTLCVIVVLYSCRGFLKALCYGADTYIKLTTKKTKKDWLDFTGAS